MDLLDTHLPYNDVKKSGTRQLNVLLLVAFLLYSFGHNQLPLVFSQMYSGDVFVKIGPWLGPIRLVLMLVGAVLADLAGQNRIFSMIGVGIILFLGIVCSITDAFAGFSIYILLFLAYGFAYYAMLKRLLANTAYFSNVQKVIVLSATGVSIFVNIFWRTAHYVMKADNNTGLTLIGCLLLAVSLILLIVDNEPEPEQNTVPSYIEKQPNFWTHFLLPLSGFSIVINWITQQNHLFYELAYMDHQAKSDLFLYIITTLVFVGLVLLLFYAAKVENHWVYIGIGAGLLATVFLVCLVQKEVNPDTRWIFLPLNIMGMEMVGVGTSLWIYRHSAFPLLALLIASQMVCAVLADLISKYVHLTPPHTFTEF